MLKNYFYLGLVILGVALTTLYWAHLAQNPETIHPPLYAHAHAAFRHEAQVVWEV